MKALFYVLAVFMAVAVFWITCQLGSQGNPVVFLSPIIISTLMMGVVRVWWENGTPRGLYSYETQSWAFLFGDLLALPFAFAMLAVGWRSLDGDGWYRSSWWMLAAAVVGVAFACGWHYLLETPGYTADGYAELLKSPSKLWHDFVVYGSVSGSLVYLGIPVIGKNLGALFTESSSSSFGWWALVGVLAWGLLGVADNTIHKLYPPNLHPPVSETKLA